MFSPVKRLVILPSQTSLKCPVVLKHLNKLQNTAIRTYIRGPSAAYRVWGGNGTPYFGRREGIVNIFGLKGACHVVNPVQIIPASRCLSTGVIKYSSHDERGGGEGSTGAQYMSQGTKSTLYYIAALGVLAFGFSYAAVPLYRIFCQAYSYGGTTQEGHDVEKVEDMLAVKDRVIRVRFNADIAASMTWNFRPQQSEIKVHPGETALAFYTAKNPTNRPVIGISTYNVVPFDAGQYFNKIQCFCFEEQMLNPHEEVHMPVFFYIDPEFADDPKMQNVDMLTLSYTFFEAREGLQLPMPQFAR